MVSNSKTRIEKRKRLSALFEIGKPVRFGVNGVDMPEHPDDVVVWVGPPNPFQRDMALRDSQGARARAMLEARDEVHSDQHVNARLFLSGLDLDALLDYVLSVDEMDRLAEARREVLQEPEWKDFNELRDAMRLFDESGADRDDPEWAPLMDRDVRFGEQVNAVADRLREGALAGLKLLGRPVLEKRALDKRVEQSGMQEFMRVYEETMLFYACRDEEDHHELFFESPKEIKELPDNVQEALKAALSSFIGEAAEAKNSQGVASSSDSSALPARPEVIETSGPEA